MGLSNDAKKVFAATFYRWYKALRVSRMMAVLALEDLDLVLHRLRELHEACLRAKIDPYEAHAIPASRFRQPSNGDPRLAEAQYVYLVAQSCVLAHFMAATDDLRDEFVDALREYESAHGSLEGLEGSAVTALAHLYETRQEQTLQEFGHTLIDALDREDYGGGFQGAIGAQAEHAALAFFPSVDLSAAAASLHRSTTDLDFAAGARGLQQASKTAAAMGLTDAQHDTAVKNCALVSKTLFTAAQGYVDDGSDLARVILYFGREVTGQEATKWCDGRMVSDSELAAIQKEYDEADAAFYKEAGEAWDAQETAEKDQTSADIAAGVASASATDAERQQEEADKAKASGSPDADNLQEAADKAKAKSFSDAEAAAAAQTKASTSTENAAKERAEMDAAAGKKNDAQEKLDDGKEKNKESKLPNPNDAEQTLTREQRLAMFEAILILRQIQLGNPVPEAQGHGSVQPPTTDNWILPFLEGARSRFEPPQNPRHDVDPADSTMVVMGYESNGQVQVALATGIDDLAITETATANGGVLFSFDSGGWRGRMPFIGSLIGAKGRGR